MINILDTNSSINLTIGFVALTTYAIYRGRNWWYSTSTKENKETAPPKLTNSQLESIRRLRKERLDNPEMEKRRLKEAGLISAQDKSEKLFSDIDRYLNSFEWSVYERPEKAKERAQKIKFTSMLYFQGKALQTILKDHYIFWHAQDTYKWVGCTELIDAIEKRKDSSIEHYKFLRFVPEKSPTKITDYSQNYKNCLEGGVHDAMPQARRDLICVSSALEDIAPKESALWHVFKNHNQLGEDNLEFYIQPILHTYPRVTRAEAKEFALKIKQLVAKNENTLSCSNLFAFCIPKNKHQDVQYRSEPGGAPCSCHRAKDSSEVLVDENGEQIEHAHRIYTPALDPKQHCIYKFSAIPKKERKELKLLIQNGLDQFEEISKKRSRLTYWALGGVEAAKNLFWQSKDLLKS